MAEDLNAKEAAKTDKTDKKVELDLDDAPFLEDDPAPEPAKEPETVPPGEVVVAASPPSPGLLQRLTANKKKLAVAGGCAVFLLVAAVLVNVFLFSEPEPPSPPQPEPEKVAIAPKPLPPAATPNFTAQFEPFWVELKDTEGAIRFLTFRFSIPTNNEILFAEMNGKMLILRDALFYYLRNQPIISLRDEASAQEFKADLMTVINEHLGSGKISEILILDYLIQ